MAQPGTVRIDFRVDTREARRKVKALRTLAQEADQALARLDDSLGTFEAEWAARLAEYGIKLEIEEGT